MPTLNIHEMASYRKTLQSPDPQLEEDYANLDYLHLIEYTFEDCFFPTAGLRLLAILLCKIANPIG